ncbi:MAG: hypothetical protein CME26_04215 [Gemmatimonadetes bacterium]|nr:hypothetical protein [Gemmatimonadota bacterium]
MKCTINRVLVRGEDYPEPEGEWIGLSSITVQHEKTHYGSLEIRMSDIEEIVVFEQKTDKGMVIAGLVVTLLVLFNLAKTFDDISGPEMF